MNESPLDWAFWISAVILLLMYIAAKLVLGR